MQLRWRLVSLAALILYVGITVLAVLLLVGNLGFAVALGLAVSLLAYAAWMIFAGDSRRVKIGRVYLIIGLAVLVVELVYFLRDPRNAKVFLLILGLSALYLGLVRLIRGQYWKTQRQRGELAHQPARFQNPYLIINPKSGNGRAIKAQIPELAIQQNIKVLVTKPDDNVEELARQAALQGADVLGISGGDGSIGAVAKVALEHKLPMVVLPGGTRCHFARDLGLDPKQIVDALAGFHGVKRQIDVGEINGRIFLNNASFGLYADIVDNPDYRDHKVEVSRRVLRELVNGQKPMYDLQFQHGSQKFQQAALILIGVNRYNTVNIFELGHRERLDGGQLQITAFLKVNDALVKTLLKPVKLDKLRQLRGLEEFKQWEVETFRIISPSGRVEAGVDGERESYDSPVTVKIRPRALTIYVPAEGVRNRPKNPFGWQFFRRLWSEGVKAKND